MIHPDEAWRRIERHLSPLPGESVHVPSMASMAHRWSMVAPCHTSATLCPVSSTTNTRSPSMA